QWGCGLRQRSQTGWRSGRMWATGLPGLSTSFLLVVRITLALLLRIWTAMEISISWELRGTVTSSSTCVKVVTPVISPEGGIGPEMQLVHIATETPGATIRYTLDGSEPTTSSALYAEPLMVAGSASTKPAHSRMG